MKDQEKELMYVFLDESLELMTWQRIDLSVVIT
jgi:hypothetical protein